MMGDLLLLILLILIILIIVGLVQVLWGWVKQMIIWTADMLIVVLIFVLVKQPFDIMVNIVRDFRKLIAILAVIAILYWILSSQVTDYSWMNWIFLSWLVLIAVMIAVWGRDDSGLPIEVGSLVVILIYLLTFGRWLVAEWLVVEWLKEDYVLLDGWGVFSLDGWGVLNLFWIAPAWPIMADDFSSEDWSLLFWFAPFYVLIQVVAAGFIVMLIEELIKWPIRVGLNIWVRYVRWLIKRALRASQKGRRK